MNKKINSNGFDYVDLGLPSGTLWATMNVGASNISDCGLYFQWGDTIGYSTDQIGKDKQFSWDDYKFCINGSSSNFSKYTTEGATLELEDDAAHVHMGGDWHIPSPTQINELVDNTTNEWTKKGGVKGRLFTSKKDSSKFIFIPAAGYAWDYLINDSDECGLVWSSMLGTYAIDFGKALYFFSRNIYLNNYNRSGGFSVRGVIG